MRINNNISALNTWRGLSQTDNNLSKSLEKLSSGLRINRAGDDAAGLAISEKMRGQIKGLNQAVRNAQDGISLLQTAEGALNETHSILQRMRELTIQASNDTNTDVDRGAIQKEMDSLATEVTRIATTTEFNSQKLLNGTFTTKNLQIGANADQKLQVSINNMDASALKVVGATGSVDAAVKEVAVVKTGTPASPVFTAGDVTVTDTNNTFAKDMSIKIKITTAGTGAANGEAIADITINGKTYTGVKADTTATTPVFTLDGSKFSEFKTGEKVVLAGANDAVATDEYNIEIAGRTATTVGLDVSTFDAAKASLTKIDDAIKAVSDERSQLGAWQNRLEHTINNLGVAAENMTAAESRIRDVDMAAEMMNMTRQNILSQAGTAMMAQANQRPQAILQLLR